MAAGDNVVNLESGVVVLPGHAAVFAAVPGPSPNQLSHRAIHACSVGFRLPVTGAALEGATSLGLEDAKKATDAAVRLDLGLLFGGERACARLGGERVHAVLVGGAESQRQNALGCRRGERSFVWSCNPGQDGRLMVG